MDPLPAERRDRSARLRDLVGWSLSQRRLAPAEQPVDRPKRLPGEAAPRGVLGRGRGIHASVVIQGGNSKKKRLMHV